MLNKELLIMGGGLEELVSVTIQYRSSKIFPELIVSNVDTGKIYLRDDSVTSSNETLNLRVPAGTSLKVEVTDGLINVLQMFPPWTNIVQITDQVIIVDIADQEVFVEIEITR